ncbi:unnamed protein product, partial [Porites lobata]
CENEQSTCWDELTHLNIYSRRWNLIFYRVNESKDEDCFSLVRDVLTRNLNLPQDEVLNMKLCGAHRLGKPNRNRARPLIARFTCRADRDRVWKARYRLKNSRISMGEDLPKHIQEIRKNVLIPAMKKIKQETPRHKASVIGDKLVVNGKVYFHYDVPKKWLPVNSSTPLKPSFDVKFQSLNVRGLNKSIKRRSIFRWLHNQKFHFTFLQETYSSKECAQIWEAEWGGKVYFSHGSSHSKGVMTLVTPNLDVKVEKCIQDTNGRFLILDLLIDELHLILVNIYAPNDANQQVTFFKELENQLEDFAKENIIIAVQHLANLYNLTDIWRDRNPNDNRFTWRNKSLKIQCRLDFFLISKELSSDTHACNIINAPETDHSAVTLHLKTEDLLQPKAPGFWKF